MRCAQRLSRHGLASCLFPPPLHDAEAANRVPTSTPKSKILNPKCNPMHVLFFISSLSLLTTEPDPEPDGLTHCSLPESEPFLLFSRHPPSLFFAFFAFHISFSRDFFPRACTPEERCGETGCELLSEETFRYIHHQRRGGQRMEHSTTPTIHGPGSNARGPGGGYVMPRTKVESRKSKAGLKPSRHRSIPKANQENSETE